MGKNDLFQSSILCSDQCRQIPTFDLQCGVRQDDALFPFLFNTALKPPVIGIRSHSGILGVRFGYVESVIKLFADLLICLSDPVLSVPKLLNYIKSFSRRSRYTIK